MGRIVLALSVVCLALAGAAAGGIALTIVPSSAPNQGLASWTGYLANAMNSLANGLGSIGDRSTDPCAYEVAGEWIEPGDILVTSFHSWRGLADPNGAFANQHGNRLHFGLHAVGDGTTQFCLEDLTFDVHSSDPNDTLAWSGDFIGFSYNGTTRYGVNWGADRAKGGGDDTIYNSGNGTTLVDELVYVGVGNSWWPGGDAADPVNPPEGRQQSIDDAVAWITENYPIQVTCTYALSVYDADYNWTYVTPEPASLSLLGLGGLALLRRRRGVAEGRR